MATPSEHREVPGLFLVVDGPEGSGKSTQVERLARFLETTGRTVRVFRDPGGTRAGERIRALLLDTDTGEVGPLTEILLFLASRAQLIEEKIRPSLARGETVVLDRFHYSTLAYQVHGLGLGEVPKGKVPKGTVDMIRSINGEFEPDCVFFLDVPPEVGMKRIGKQPDRIEKRDSSFHDRVRSSFLSQAEAAPERITVIDATRSQDAVFGAIQEEVRRVL